MQRFVRVGVYSPHAVSFKDQLRGPKMSGQSKNEKLMKYITGATR